MARLELVEVKCFTCGEKTTHMRDDCNHILHVLLTVCTGGLWVVVWIYKAMKADELRCTECGSRK